MILTALMSGSPRVKRVAAAICRRGLLGRHSPDLVGRVIAHSRSDLHGYVVLRLDNVLIFPLRLCSSPCFFFSQ